MKKYAPTIIILVGYLLAGTATTALYQRNCVNAVEHRCWDASYLAGVFWPLYVPVRLWDRVLP